MPGRRAVADCVGRESTRRRPVVRNLPPSPRVGTVEMSRSSQSSRHNETDEERTGHPNMGASEVSTVERAYEEFIDFFARGSTSREILRFRPSAAVQQRARYLVDRSKSGELTSDEAVELDRLGQVEHLMQLVKARARTYAQPES